MPYFHPNITYDGSLPSHPGACTSYLGTHASQHVHGPSCSGQPSSSGTSSSYGLNTYYGGPHLKILITLSFILRQALGTTTPPYLYLT